MAHTVPGTISLFTTEDPGSKEERASMAVQWYPLANAGDRADPWSADHGAPKPMSHSRRACALERGRHSC